MPHRALKRRLTLEVNAPALDLRALSTLLAPNVLPPVSKTIGSCPMPVIAQTQVRRSRKFEQLR